MGPNSTEDHLKRLEDQGNFRNEQRVADYTEAVRLATERSMETNKHIYLMKENETSFEVNSHGVEKIGFITLAILKRGQVIKTHTI